MHTLADAWVHTLDPVVLPISGNFAVRWYGLAYIAGFVAGWALLRLLAARGLLLLTKTQVTDLLLALILGVLVGGRIGYVLVYEPHLLIEFSAAPPWWGLIAINKGGMASHGGIAGVIVATLWFARRVKAPWLHVLDAAALVAPIGLFFGRLANFVNGELLGKIVAPPGEPAPRWSVRYPQELLSGHAPELTPAQESRLLDVLAPYHMPDEQTYGPAVQRMFEALHRGGATAKELARELPTVLAARHPSQLYQAAAEGLLVFAAVWIVWARPRKPGVVGCWFLIVYGLGRIATEFWRLPDDQFAVQRIAGLSRGQWLSAAMVVVGVVVLPLVSKRRVERLGGWLTARGRTKNAAG